MTQAFREDPYLPPAPLWPKIIGWILLLWGLLGIGLSTLGFANGSLDVKTYQGLPDWLVAFMRVDQIIGFMTAILCALSGLYLLLKARRGYSLAKWWIVFSLTLSVVWFSVQIARRDELKDWMKRAALVAIEKQKKPSPEITPEMIKVGWIVKMGCSGIVGIGFPFAIGLCLFSGKRRADVALWAH